MNGALTTVLVKGEGQGEGEGEGEGMSTFRMFYFPSSAETRICFWHASHTDNANSRMYA